MEERNCKKLRKLDGGEDAVCYWTPDAKDLPLAEALLNAAWKTSFIMAAKVFEDTAPDELTLVPVGVAFSCPTKGVPEQVNQVFVFESADDGAEVAATVSREDED